jgi:tetratricopeptide (TPR) repeat protein
LQKIFTVAAINAQSYLTLREHYDEALATLATLHDIGDSHDRAFTSFQRILVLFMADRTEQAFGELEARVHDDDADIADWGQLVMSNLRYRRLDEAAQALAAAQAWTDEQSELELISAEETREWRGYLATLYADVAMRRGEWDAAMGHFDEALAADPMYGKNLHLFYTTLMQAGQPERALTYIKQDSAYPIRSHFWHGVALQRLGQAEAAAAQWQQVLEVDLQTSEEPSFSEYVLTHYYLGDRERIGLGNILRILQEDKRYEWQTLFLAGLGWAIQEGGMENAKTNLQFAINQRRTAAQGKLLPYQTWTYLRDLLPEDTQQELRKYFETEWI